MPYMFKKLNSDRLLKEVPRGMTSLVKNLYNLF
jgi:hypothetical protein